MTIKISIPPQPKREVKKLTIKILDQDALLAAYPALKKEIVVTKVDRSGLRKIVNAFKDVGMDLPPGVAAYYASELEKETPELDIQANIKASGV